MLVVEEPEQVPQAGSVLVVQRPQELPGVGHLLGGLGRGLGKHIKDKETTRKALFYSFSKQTNAAFDRILASVEVLAKNLGTEDVPMTDQLDGFRESFAQLGDNFVGLTG